MNYPFYRMETKYQILGSSGIIHEFNMVYNFHDKIEIELLRLLETKPKGIFVFARITRQLPEVNNWANPTISPIGQLIHQQDFSLEYLKSKMTFRDGLFADFIYFKECVDEKVLESLSDDLGLNDYSQVKSKKFKNEG